MPGRERIRRVMRSWLLVGVTAGCIVLAGLAPAAALATSPTLDFTYGFSPPYDEHQLAPGEAFDLWNNIGVTFEAEGGYVSCVPHDVIYDDQGIAGVDVTNNEKVDTVGVTQAFGLLTANGREFCESDLGSEVQMRLEVPKGATLTLSTKAVAELKSTSSGPYQADVFFDSGESGCYYTFKTLKGAVFTEGYTEVDFAKTKLKLNKSRSAAFCWKTAYLELPFDGVDNEFEQFFASSVS